MHLNQRLNGWEYGINFSSEILVAIIVFSAALANLVIFNPFKAEYNHNDNSLASQLLRYHSNLNPQLADKQNTISTKIATAGIFSQASANSGQVLGVSTVAEDSEESYIDDSGITKPNPDSIQSLVSRQVTIYKTKPFDTVYTVAKEFGLKPQTVRDTNGLPNYALKANWDLIIPPVDGIVIQVNNPNLTLTDVAGAYSADIKKIVSYNALEDEEDMVELGGYLIIPGGTLPAPKASEAPVQKPAKNKAFKPSVPKLTSIAGNHKFAAGYCTDYVARKVPGIKWGGNANQWISNSKKFGATVDRSPAAGSILVTNENRRYGHVAYIESVDGDKVTISEWNYSGLYKKTVRTLDIDDSKIKGVIHP